MNLQHCIDWNIRARDAAKRRGQHLRESCPQAKELIADADRDARHFQRNIDDLNRRQNDG